MVPLFQLGHDGIPQSCSGSLSQYGEVGPPELEGVKVMENFPGHGNLMEIVEEHFSFNPISIPRVFLDQVEGNKHFSHTNL
mgnify:CR=1 FL=1